MLRLFPGPLSCSLLYFCRSPQTDNFFTRPSTPTSSRNELHALGSKGLGFVEAGSVKIALEMECSLEKKLERWVRRDL